MRSTPPKPRPERRRTCQDSYEGWSDRRDRRDSDRRFQPGQPPPDSRWSRRRTSSTRPAPPATAAAPAPDRMAQLKQLGELKAQGVLTEQEFAAEKAKILG